MKKRLLSLLLALTLACTLLVFPANAAEVVDSGSCGENVTWVLTQDDVLTIRGEGAMENYNWYGSPFYANKSITSVVVEGGVTSIGNNAFSGCSSLTSVTIPDSVTSIGEYAFSGCSSLTGVVIPDSVTSIGEYAFSGCGSLTSVTIPDSVTSIGNYTFYNCSSLTNVTIPDSVTSIGDNAFSNCSSLTSVAIPESITRIGLYAFSGCSSLTSVTIPDSVTYLGGWAFDECISLESIMIPDSVTDVRDYAFYGCKNLTSVMIVGGVERIGNSAFQNCTSLESISVKLFQKGSIASYAFQGCTALKSVEVTAMDWNTIGSNAFENCTSLESFSITGESIRINKNAFSGCSSLKSFRFPVDLSLEANAFDGCSSLTSITIPYIDTIPERAFQNCTGLESLTIESGLKTIDNYAFLGCSALKTVTLPDSLTNVNTGAFRNCNSIANVYYGGNSTQWSEIAIKSYNEPLTGANIHYSGSAPAKIETDPADAAAPVGTDVCFTVAASGDIASYQWQVKTPSGSWKNSNATGCKTTTLEITVTEARNGYQYRCIVTDADGNSVTSEPATLTVVKAVTITGDPVDSVGKLGGMAAFAVEASGEGLTYQWQYSDNSGKTWKKSSVTGPVYTAKLTSAKDGRLVRCIVTDQFGNTATSDAAAMRVLPVVITNQPKDYVGKVNSTASFAVTASGNGLTYQWQVSDDGKTWSNSSVKAAKYTTRLTAARDGRMVRCIVTDANGNSATSSAASMNIG